VNFDLVVRGGRVVTEDGVIDADIGILGGKIASVASGISSSPDQEIDASGCLVIPGAVDVHTHFANSLGTYGRTADDYESGTQAAAAGGITTCINYSFQARGETLQSALDREFQNADGNSLIDFGVHIGVTDIRSTPALDEFARLAEQGVTSLKVFTTVDEFMLSDRDLLRVLEAARVQRMLVNIHAEDDALVQHLTETYLARAPHDIRSLTKSRPDESEAVAVERSAAYARVAGCPVYFVHVSSAAALRAISRARKAGGVVYAEARPAYLFLDERSYDLPDQQGRKFASIPPLRPLRDQRALWRALASGEIQTYATDHTTWTMAIKTDPRLTFAEVPGGIPDVQTSVGMLFSEGVSRGRFSVERFVDLCSANPAKIFGLWPMKGRIGVGSDADLVLIDPNLRKELKAEDMLSRCDYLPYAGYRTRGWPVLTMSRGDVIWDRGRIAGAKGRGRFLRRERLADRRSVFEDALAMGRRSKSIERI
jgi:dihydropyrimidinase